MSVVPSRDGVVDASVGAKLFLDEPFSLQAELLFSSLDSDVRASLYVPDLFFAECASILWKSVRRFGYSPDHAREALRSITALRLRVVGTLDLAREALEIALRHQVTPYDACYVALADRLELPLFTADESLVRRLGRTAHGVVWVGDLPTVSR